MTMDEDLKARLLKPRLPEDQVDVEGVGTVRVRGLSRGEVYMLQKTSKDVEGFEQRAVHLCMIDPQLSEAEVAGWFEAAPAGELEPVVEKIRELSGIAPGSEKEAMVSFRDDSGAGV